MLIRISAVILVLFSVLFMPFWLTILLVLAGMFYFSIFWEAVVLLLLSDFLYGVGEIRFQGVVFVSSIIATIVLLAIEALKKKLKFYRS